MQRREFLKAAGTIGAAVTTGLRATAGGELSDEDKRNTKNYLRSIRPSRKQVENFLSREHPPENLSRNDGWTYDSELGWVLCDSVRGRSVDGSKGFYHYEADGARKVVNFPDRPCRIHTYGNSFTHCDQVSDGETWQEYLASHIQEPIGNYGVGGYGVYQAFRRMLRVEKKKPADYIILNIWDDDHFRNLDSWRSIRFGQRTSCGFTLPYLKVNLAQQSCRKLENICPAPADVYKLCDEDFVWQTFRDDAVLKVVLGTRGGPQAAKKLLEPVAQSFGASDEQFAGLQPARAIRRIHTEAALYATQNIVSWTEQFVRQTGKKLMILLSFGRGNIAAALRGSPAFDQSFVEWLKDKPYPVIDMRDCFRAEYAQFKTDVDKYLARYYIGHHNPAGNFFTAWAIKNRLVEWLDPVPAPYR